MDVGNMLEVAYLTHVGQKRNHNEDALASETAMGLAILADGMGGYQAGEVASALAVQTIMDQLKQSMPALAPGQIDMASGMQAESQLLNDAVASANQCVYHMSQTHSECAGMGTTLVLGLFTNDRLLAGHIGDSRMYRLRGEDFSQITEDHSLVQEEIKYGLITPEEARTSLHKNLVTRALGIDPTVELELHEHEVQAGDLYLLCSDGLTDMVDDDEIHSILDSLGVNLQLAANQLVHAANDNGGNDNISVILVKVLGSFSTTQHWYDNFLRWLK